MTTPDPLDGLALPSSYVAKLNPGGSGTMFLTVGQSLSDSVYIHLPIGVSTIQVSWPGEAECYMLFRPDGSGESAHRVMTIPRATSPTMRTSVLQISADHPNARLNLATVHEGTGDAMRRVGIVVIPIQQNSP